MNLMHQHKNAVRQGIIVIIGINRNEDVLLKHHSPTITGISF